MKLIRTMIAVAAIAAMFVLGIKHIEKVNDSVVNIHDPILTSQVNQWKSKMTKNNIKWKSGLNRIESISFGKSEGHAGLSYNNKIILDPILKNDIFKLKFTLWHELGHAVYKLPHGDGIMIETIPDTETIKLNWERLQDDYYVKCKKLEFNVY